MNFLIFLAFFSLNSGILLPQAAAEISAKKAIVSQNNKSTKAITDVQLEQHTKALKRKKINSTNFSHVLYKDVCQVLKKIKKTPSLSKDKKNNYLIEVIKIYDLVLDYSLDHNDFYCLYNNFKYKEREQIIELSKVHLSESKANYFADRLATCHKEATEGNGNNPSLEKNFPGLLPSLDYKKLSSQNQLKYSMDLRKAYLDLENNGTSYSLNNYLNLLDILFPSAFAEQKRKCLIGGSLRDRVYSSRLGRSVCSVKGNTCDGRANTFRCGSLFNQECVSVYGKAINRASKSCYLAAKNKPLDLVDYKKFMQTNNKDYQNYCKSKNLKIGPGCAYYIERIKELMKFYSEQSDRTTQTTEETEKDYQNYIYLSEEISRELNTESRIVRHLSDTIFSNGTCLCNNGTDRCKRGCLTTDQAKNKKPVYNTRCVNSKPIDESTALCMRHVNGAIMNTIHAFLARHCDNNEIENSINSQKNYKQCMKSGYRPKLQTICNQSFVFDHALCGLNLDGDDKRLADAKINKNTKKDCQQKDREGNKAIRTISLIADDGSGIEDIPIFKKIDMPADPEDLPEGAIIVATSQNPSGHIEIKTNKKECEGNYCFCSDFCVSRKGGYNLDKFQPQAVFIFNPKVTDYFSLKIR